MQISVADSAGAVARQLTSTGRRGLNRVVIPFAVGGGRGRGGNGGAPAANAGTTIVPGRYTVTLEAAGQRLTRPAVVRERLR